MVQVNVALLSGRSCVNQVYDSFEFTLGFLLLFESRECLDVLIVLFLAKLCLQLVSKLSALNSSEKLSWAVVESSAHLLRLDELLAVGDFRRLRDALVGGSQVTIEHVLCNRVVEELRFLHDETEHSAEVNNIVLLYIDAIDEHRAELNIVESHHKVDKGRLALARFTHNGDVVISFDFQVQAFEDPLLEAGWVAEPDIFEFNRALESLRVD